MPTTKTDLSLAAKLAEVMGLMRNIPKEGFNKAQNYRFVRESDVAEKASALLAERHVFLHQNVVSHSMTELYRTQSGNTMYLTTVDVEFTWIDGESGEKMPASTFVGYGADTGDKGIYKAMTGAEKYFLMKTFLVSTGDDPESDEKVDKAVAAAGARSGPRVVRGSQPDVQRGGKTSTVTSTQVTEIARLAKVTGLSGDDVVDLIRERIDPEADIDPQVEGKTLRAYLESLDAKKAGLLIEAITERGEKEDDVYDGSI